MKSRDARALGYRTLAAKSDTAALDSRLLLCSVLGISQAELFADDRILSQSEEAQFRSFLDQRASGVCVAAIIGHKEFYGRDFAVNRTVLVPRPDTETLVDKALSLVNHDSRILDICTGTGCIGITIKAELEKRGLLCDLTLSDVSPDALAVASDNCRQIIENKAKCILSNLYEAFDGERFDLITANPPYIAPSERESLSTEVLHEPELALFSGDGGMALIRRIISEGPMHLVHGGLLVLECGCNQADETRMLLESSGFERCFIECDLNGLPRCVGGFLYA
ncbi:MAG: peptide chain release factor N(5)-glutamine methyltransferase [Sphaerochaetaceae bacterium]